MHPFVLERSLARRVLRLIVSVWLAGLLPVSACLVASATLGCGADQDRPAASAAPDDGKARGADGAAGKQATRASGKKWKGWRWRGKGDECFFKVDRRCYSTFEKACSAARCGKRGCTRSSSAPVAVACVGDEAAGDE